MTAPTQSQIMDYCSRIIHRTCGTRLGRYVHSTGGSCLECAKCRQTWSVYKVLSWPKDMLEERFELEANQSLEHGGRLVWVDRLGKRFTTTGPVAPGEKWEPVE